MLADIPELRMARDNPTVHGLKPESTIEWIVPVPEQTALAGLRLVNERIFNEFNGLIGVHGVQMSIARPLVKIYAIFGLVRGDSGGSKQTFSAVLGEKVIEYMLDQVEGTGRFHHLVVLKVAGIVLEHHGMTLENQSLGLLVFCEEFNRNLALGLGGHRLVIPLRG